MNKDNLHISLPFPITNHLDNIINDPCKELLREKAQYNDTIRWCASEYKKLKLDTKSNELNKIEKMKVPKYLVDLSYNQIKDPDLFFSGDYNWYYTGNCLAVIEYENQKYFVRPTQNNKLCFTNINNLAINKIANINYKQLIHSINYIENNDLGCFTMRLKNRTYLVNYSNLDDEIKLSKMWQHKSPEVPIIDSKMNKYNNAQMGILKLDRKFCEFDLNKNEENVILINTLHDKLPDKLMQFEYMDENNLLFMDRKSMHLFDRRETDVVEFNLQNGYFVCNYLSSFTRSKRDTNYVYFISVHDVLKVDLRQQKVVKTWSHLLQHTPYIINSYMQNNDEYFIFSSQNARDKALLIENYSENNICKHIPSNNTTLHKANFRKMTLCEDMKKRLNCSTVGVASLEDNSQAIFCNSLGDIFVNIISDYEQEDTYPVSKLIEWMDNIPKTQKELVVTGFTDISTAKRTLDATINKENLKKFMSENTKLTKFYEKFEGDFAMGAIWEDDEDDSVRNVLDTTITPVNKVSEWLNSL